MEKLLRSELKNTFDSDLVNHKRIIHDLDSSILHHSLSLEVNTSYPFFKDSKKIRKIRKKMRDSHLNAWTYALDNIGNTQSYDHTDLNVLAKLIEPSQVIHPIKGYRTYSVSISGATHDTIEPYCIYGEMSEIIEKVDSMKSPLEKAIYSHFHIARVHPFEDGNGRTARIVQNSLLCGANLLPINVAPFQRDLYIAILDDAVNDYNSKDSHYLYSFSEFLVQNLFLEVKSYKRRLEYYKRKNRD
jgi:hypothetical protein